MRTYYPEQVVSEFKPTTPYGLKVLKPATNVSKLSRTTFEYDRPKKFMKSAKHNSLIIQKGRWKGSRLFFLSLPEGQTCPDSCPLNTAPTRRWGKGHPEPCYGVHMPLAKRYDPYAKGFMNALSDDISLLASKYKFVVRLHELGDFFSIDYVNFWVNSLEETPNLNIYGYSHRDDDIGLALDESFQKHPKRFVIMNSSETHTTNIRPPSFVGERSGNVTCPYETSPPNTKSCITCMLWGQGSIPISFI